MLETYRHDMPEHANPASTPATSQPRMNVTPGATAHSITVPRDAVCRLGAAGHPLSPTVLMTYLALLTLPDEFDRFIPYEWLERRVAVNNARAARATKELEHARLISVERSKGRAPRLRCIFPSDDTVQVPTRLLWSTSAADGGPPRDGAAESVVALLCIVATCDPMTRSGSASWETLTNWRHRLSDSMPEDSKTLSQSRAALVDLAGDAMTFTRQRGRHAPGKGSYWVEYDFSSFGGQPRKTRTTPGVVDGPPVTASPPRSAAGSQPRTVGATRPADGDMRRALLRAHATLAAGGPSSVDDTLAVLAAATGWDRDQARAAFEAMRTFEIA